jgi:hypothetical protein
LIREVVWAGAASPDEARKLVASKTARLVEGNLGAKLSSPWLDERLAACVLEPSRSDVPKGAVIDGKGRDVSQS